MDNEEIKKLLQELKKNSDESTAVRSQVVKIHFDTPAEAARRRKARARAEAEAARIKLEEEEKARAAEEARRLEAERMAQEVVEEAKLQAKSGFSSDLDQDLLEAEQDLPDEETGESAYDLDLNWEYEKPHLSSDPIEEEDGESDEDDPDYMSDSDEFRDGIIPDDSTPLRSALGVIKGGFAALTERLREKEPRENDGDQEEDGEEEMQDAAEEAVPSSGNTAVRAPDEPESLEPAEDSDTAEDTPEEHFGPDEEWKRRMEEPPKYNLKRRRLPKKPFFHFPGKSKKNQDAEDVPAENADEVMSSGQEASEDGGAMPETAEREYEEPGDVETMDAVRESEAAGYNEPEYTEPETAAKEASEPDSEFPDQALTDADVPHLEVPEMVPEESEPVPEKKIEVIDLDEKTNNREAEVIPLDPGSTGPLPRLKAGRFLSSKKSGPETKKAPKRLFGGKKEKNKAEKPADGMKAAPPKEEKEPNETWLRMKEFLLTHRKQCLIALAAVLVLVIVIAAITLILPGIQSKRRATIRLDEGLTVQILSQPESFTPEGDVSFRIKAPETIQSVTINGESIDIEQGRTVDLDYFARTGALEMMVVSTDKVRSANITLAYVDSQPPVVTVAEKDGMIELSAEDTETGVKAIYIGKNDGLSDVPMFEEYTEPFPADPDEVISYYAVDEAGNSSTPAVSAMVPADSIAFTQKRFGIFPASSTTVQIVTEPENAFVNNLTFEIENEKIAKVSGNVLTGISEGDTKIIASADGLTPVSATVSVKSDRSVTISAIGDCTLGTDINLSQNTSFNAYQAMYGNSYFFQNVKTILSQDDATFANFEGTLTTSDERKDKPYAFKADPSFADILTEGSVEVVTLANNHSKDYGDVSFTDTQKALEDAGVKWCEGNDIAYMDLNGVKTAFIGIYALENGLESMDQVKSTIAEAKENGADLVIIHFHWGVELVTALDDFERQLAHAAIDAGADLVLGTHAHMILPVEKYNGRYIVYGLSNFCFGGNAYPHSYDTIIWQQTFTFTPDGLESEDDIKVIPCKISSDTSINNYQPTPATGDAADAIIQTMNSLSAEFGLTFDQYMVDGTTITE